MSTIIEGPRLPGGGGGRGGGGAAPWRAGRGVAAAERSGGDPRGTLDRARAVLAGLFGPAERRGFAVRFWDGTLDLPSGADPGFTLVLPAPWALRRMLLPPSELRLAEAFARGDFEIEGDLEAAAAAAQALRDRLARPGAIARLVPRLLALPAGPRARAPARRRLGAGRFAPRHSRRRDRAAVRSHYDVGNDFYALWLDRRMVYSCAYFPAQDADLDAAQEAKLDHLCRKLRLAPGERLLDIGCGWGGLVMHAAARYGARAVGVTLSAAQAQLAERRIAAAGLADRCAVEVRDYRELPDAPPFDKIVSVGMYEHVGRRELPRYFAKVYRLLRPGGLFVNHGIVAAPEPRGLGPALRRALWRKGRFIDRYVFPDGELVPVATAIGAAEAAGFETRDVESLREHYALTLRHWRRRLEASEAESVRLVGDETHRVWRLFLAGSAQAFASGRLGLAQIVFAKPDAAGRVSLPLTRADLYGAR